MTCVYVATIVWGRDKYEYHSYNAGVFTKEESAVQAIGLALAKANVPKFNDDFGGLSYSQYCTRKFYAHDNEGDNEPVMSENDYYQLFKSATTQTQLDDLCDEYSDSYYDDGWTWQIEKREIDTQYPVDNKGIDSDDE